MALLLAVTAGVLFAAGIYMILRRSLVKILVGLLLLSYAVNLLLFNSSDLIPARPPLIPEGSQVPPAVLADPVPQALILTAIVISFGLTAFSVVLMRQAYGLLGTDDMDEMRCTDLPCDNPQIHIVEEDFEESI